MADTTSRTRLSTGNEFISIPDISTANAGIYSLGFMYSAFRACVELHGAEDQPLLIPLIEINGQEIIPEQVENESISYWIPQFRMRDPNMQITSTVFAPFDRRGFVCVLEIENISKRELTLRAGWRGCWESSSHTAKISRPLSGRKHGHMSKWRPGVPVVEFRTHIPLFAMAMVSQDVMPAKLWDKITGCEVVEWNGEGLSVDASSPVCYQLVDEYVVASGAKITVPVFVGIGLEEASAIAAAEELRLQGWERAITRLKSWLDAHVIELDDPHLKQLLNMNSFYNFFFSQATTLDSEEFVLMTSRSSRNDSCGSYCDRDAMRWSLPAVLQINWAQGRKMLTYAFTTQLNNIGLRSRFIDGITLEPGLQLDQLCGPIRALHTYVQLTGDMSVLFDRRVQAGINAIQQVLGAQRHTEATLFETLLLPSGEPARYPYVCYSNVLIWRILHDLRDLYERIRDVDRADEAGSLAIQVKNAIQEHFIVPGPFGHMFAREIDLEGNYELGDDPEGSLQLMSYLGYCSADDPVYKNTLSWIHSEYNPHSGRGSSFVAPTDSANTGPSFLSIINDLLTGRVEEALDFLRRAKLDNGIACESVDRNTGSAVSGMAHASCAGYLAFGMRLALNLPTPQTAIVQQKRRLSETLYQPPPEVSQDSKKARL